MTLVNENDTYNADGDRVGTVIMVDNGEFGQLPVLYFGNNDTRTPFQIARQARKSTRPV